MKLRIMEEHSSKVLRFRNLGILKDYAEIEKGIKYQTKVSEL